MRGSLLAVLLLIAFPAMAQMSAPATATTARDCAACPELALVPPGQFAMGTAPAAVEQDATTGESPAVPMSFARPYFVSTREITVAEFRRYVEATGAEPAPGCRVWLGGQWVQERDRSWRDPGFALPPRDDEPVVCVSWDDARGYAEWLAQQSGKRYRLPSEAEWEYVARGGTSFPRYWGERDSREDTVLSLACDHANVYDASAVDAHRFPWPNARCNDRAVALAPGAQYKPNAFGVHDIIGNAREWVMDCYTASYLGRPEDARAWIWQGGCERPGVRGGSWASRPPDARAPARRA
ncbi:MAG: SUMF1/EgtB/PvdO family nonheme iron enzyme, partial [Steroidobacteraceae bacterium]